METNWFILSPETPKTYLLYIALLIISLNTPSVGSPWLHFNVSKLNLIIYIKPTFLYEQKETYINQNQEGKHSELI